MIGKVTQLHCDDWEKYAARKYPKCGCATCHIRWLEEQIKFLGGAHTERLTKQGRYGESRHGKR